ncbi:helix-turn-helix transcriptional regulator [Fuscibacter oryzae]|nr:helix-turn-helix transcriptional regulator [Fuscibacter oryzae]
MTMIALKSRQTVPALLIALILFQTVCTLFFVADVSTDMKDLGLSSFLDPHILPELGATAGLVLGIVFEIAVLMRMLRKQAQLQQAMGVAAGALAEVMEGYFGRWGLTPSEADVAGFTVKGYAIAEIAGFRGSSEATVKTHLNAIYRKAGVAGRAQLVSLLVEDLFRAPLVETGLDGTTRSAARAAE